MRRRRLRVVTWNVGRLYTPTHNNRLDDADVPEVARVLGELDADVVLLQELVDPRQLAGILAGLLRPYVGKMAERCGYDRHVAVLARPALAPRFLEVVLGPSGRSALLVELALAPGLAGAAIAVHLDVASSRRRAEQAAHLVALVDSRPEPWLVVGGDLNLDPAWAAGTGREEDVATFARLTHTLRDTGRDAGATLVGLLRVDHLLLRGGGEPLARVSPRRLPLGDHQPLVLDVARDPT